MLSNIRPRVQTIAPRFERPTRATKQTDPHYGTQEHKRWRSVVFHQAGGRCEWVEPDGSRCSRCSPANRMYADHIVERSDGGAPLDPANGQLLCGSHHTQKTMEEKAKRMRANGGSDDDEQRRCG